MAAWHVYFFKVPYGGPKETKQFGLAAVRDDLGLDGARRD